MNIYFSLLFIIICFLTFSTASLQIPNEHKTSPSISAEELIKSFNLHPKHSSAIPSISFVDNPNKEEQLVERPIDIISSLSSTSATTLGHYAGYYQLPQTYGAR
jgi:hypothetical protein